jgi:hypothetical protein
MLMAGVSEGDRHPALAPGGVLPGLAPDAEHEQDEPEVRQAGDAGPQAVRYQPGLHAGKERAEQGRPQAEPGDDLADHPGLP